MKHALVRLALAGTLLLPMAFAAADTVRPEVGRPLQAAQELMKSQRHAEALARIADADAVPNKTAFEALTVARMRGAAALSAGQGELAMRSFEAALASGLLPAGDHVKLLQAMAGIAYRAKDYARAASLLQRYQKAGGGEPSMRMLLAQSHFLAGAPAEAARELQAILKADEKAGRTPTEEQLQLLANCHDRLNDAAAYRGVLEKLVLHHPKKDYWADLLRRVPQRAGFARRLSLDLLRLRLATGTLSNPAEFVEMVQLALQESSAAEAHRLVDRGFASGVLGTGAEAERQRRLGELAAKAAADEQRSLANLDADAAAAAAAPQGTALFRLGWSLYHQGQVDKGLAMMELGLHKGGLERPEDARLHLGVAALQAGQRSKAAQWLKGVQGSDGTAELARLWLAHAQGGEAHRTH
jgi:Tfp pilus assembly protein PilF